MGDKALTPPNILGKSGGTRGRGRPKGVPNRIPTAIKDMILCALDQAGGVAYLKRQAEANPSAFMGLVGKVIPLQVAGAAADGAIVHRIELIGIAAPKQLTGPA